MKTPSLFFAQHFLHQFWRIAFVAGCLVASPGFAEACDCVGSGSPGKAFEQSSAVFAGEVVQEQKGGSIHLGGAQFVDQPPAYTFKVKKSWKGPMSDSVEIRSGGRCAYYGFAKGKEFLVYAYGAPLQASICGRTKPLKNVDLEIMMLDLVSKGGNKPYRMKVRSPCFCNLSALREMTIGEYLADAVMILGSIDLVLCEVDR